MGSGDSRPGALSLADGEVEPPERIQECYEKFRDEVENGEGMEETLKECREILGGLPEAGQVDRGVTP